MGQFKMKILSKIIHNKILHEKIYYIMKHLKILMLNLKNIAILNNKKN